MSNELRMKESRQKFLIETEKEKEGYTKSVKTLLNDCEKILHYKKRSRRSFSKPYRCTRTLTNSN